MSRSLHIFSISAKGNQQQDYRCFISATYWWLEEIVIGTTNVDVAFRISWIKMRRFGRVFINEFETQPYFEKTGYFYFLSSCEITFHIRNSGPLSYSVTLKPFGYSLTEVPENFINSSCIHSGMGTNFLLWNLLSRIMKKRRYLIHLKIANLKFQQIYSVINPTRQPVHTVYGGANLFKSDTCIKMGEVL